jgi:hypothetical protein
MKKIILVSILALVLSVTFGLFATQGMAETVKWTVTSSLVNVGLAPVPDVKGHLVGLFERRGVAVYENGDVAAYHSLGTFDFINSNGPFQGYTNLTFQDGSTIMVKFEGTMKKAEGQKLAEFLGQGKYIKGTGRFQGIKGDMSFKGRYVTPYTPDKTKGDVVVNATGTYKLP